MSTGSPLALLLSSSELSTQCIDHLGPAKVHDIFLGEVARWIFVLLDSPEPLLYAHRVYFHISALEEITSTSLLQHFLDLCLNPPGQGLLREYGFPSGMYFAKM